MTAAMDTVQERWVSLPGLDLFVREAGEGPPLLLLHGWPQHSAMWEPLIGELAGDFHVIAPDLRGFGRSEAPAGPYDKHTLAADVVALMDAEGIEKATIVGHDWGGWIAWLLALEHPERVERFADLDVPPPWSRDNQVSWAKLPKQLAFSSYQWIISSPLVGERFVSSPQWLARFIRGGSKRTDVWTPERLAVFTDPMTEHARARASVMLYRTFLLREIPQIIRANYTRDQLDVPGLVIMGGESQITKLLGVPNEAPNLEVEVLGGVGHYVVDEAPEAVMERLRPFLAATT